MHKLFRIYLNLAEESGSEKSLLKTFKETCLKSQHSYLWDYFGCDFKIITRKQNPSA